MFRSLLTLRHFTSESKSQPEGDLIPGKRGDGVLSRALAAIGLSLGFVMAGGAAQSVYGDTGLPTTKAFVYPDAPAQKPFWAKRVTGYLPARDGTLLRYSVLLPRAKGRFPTIINYSGYDAGSIGGLAYRKGMTVMGLDIDAQLLKAGYAVMGLNARGTGCSEGQFDFLGRTYGQDGAEGVEFAARQDWSTGAIGMVNWSWAGMSQVMTAAAQPAHLRAIAPGMVVGDLRRDMAAPGGVPQPGFEVQWHEIIADQWDFVKLSARDEGDARCVKQVEQNLADQNARSFVKLIFEHPLRDAVTDALAPAAHADRIGVPVLSMEAFQDESTTVRGDNYQQRLDPSRTWLVQSSGGHNLYTARRFRETFLAPFLDHFVKGIPNGFERRPHTTVWMETFSAGRGLLESLDQSQPRWTFQLPGVGAPRDIEVQELHLGANGSLAHEAVAGRSQTMTYPAPSVAVNGFEPVTRWGPLPANWREASLVYTSAPMSADLLVYGTSSADLWIATTGADADVQVTLTEVRPDGQEMYIQRGWLRLSNRILDETRSTPLLPIPYDTPERIAPLNPGEPVLARIEVGKVAHVLRRGSRLRLWVNAPGQSGGYTFNIYNQPEQLALLHDREHDSVLRLGVLRGIQVPASLPECGSVLLQPCRPDPLTADAVPKRP